MAREALGYDLPVRWELVAAILWVWACTPPSDPAVIDDGGRRRADAGRGLPDAGRRDAGPGRRDAGPRPDAGRGDAGRRDAGRERADAGADAGPDVAPRVRSVTWAHAEGCDPAAPRELTVDVVVEDLDTPPEELRFSGSIDGCEGSLDAASVTVTCEGVDPARGVLTVRDGSSFDNVLFTVRPCDDGFRRF